MRLRSIVVRAFAAVVVAVTVTSLPPAYAQRKEVKIGVIYDYTGPFAAGGSQAAALGTKIAIDMINEKGGVDGYKIVPIYADAQSKAEVAINEAIRLLDQEKVQRMQMGKALSSKGGRNWGSGTSPSDGSPHKSQTQNDVFESVSLTEMEDYEEDEEVPLYILRERIITQRQDAEESLVDRMKRLKEEKRRTKVEENETLVQRMARLEMEQDETLLERKNRLRRQNLGKY
jgi:hypothetical protein